MSPELSSSTLAMLRGLTSALVEHFNHPQVVRQLALALAACPGKHWLEMLVNDDSGNLLLPDRLPRRPGALQITVLRSPNIHEIRAYNLLSMRARGEYLLFLQDDDLPPASGRWLSDALAAFAALPTLGLLGLLTGGSEPWSGLGPQSVRHWQRRGGLRVCAACSGLTALRTKLRAPRLRLRLNGSTVALQYAAWLNMGPFVMRSVDFAAAGRFATEYSREGQVEIRRAAPHCAQRRAHLLPQPSHPAQMGLGFDSELSTRVWTLGKSAALLGAPCDVSPCEAEGDRASRRAAEHRWQRGVGGHGTAASAASTAERFAQASRNLKRYNAAFAAHAAGVMASVLRANLRLEAHPGALLSVIVLRTGADSCAGCDAAVATLAAMPARAGLREAPQLKIVDTRANSSAGDRGPSAAAALHQAVRATRGKWVLFAHGEQVAALAAGDIHSAPLGAALQMLERSEDAALVGRALPLLVAREPFVYVRGFRDGLHAYDAEFAARFKLSGLRALPPPVGWPS